MRSGSGALSTWGTNLRPGSDIEDKLPNGGVVHIDILTWSGLKAPAEPSCRVPTYIVYFFKFILGGDFS